MIKIGDVFEGQLSMNRMGSAYVKKDGLKKDIYIHKKNTNKALHLDTVKIEIVEGNGRAFEGVVKEVIKRFKTEFVGTIQISDEFAFFLPDSQKMSTDIFIPLDKLNGAVNGQKVVAKIRNWKGKAPNGEIIKVLGESGDNDVEIHSILHEYELPYDFEEHVLHEADAIDTIIPQSEIDARKDLRSVTTLTIDPVDAKDFDDALSLQWIGGNMEIGVHIADVSHYLRPDTDLDKEAYHRGTSVYLVDRVIPMLPEKLSNGLCSLRPNEDKLCFSAIFTLDKNGNIINEWFGRTVINSNHRYTYEEAQEVIEKGIRPDTKHTDRAVLDLNMVAKNLRKKRLKNGSLTFDKSEVRFKLDEANKPIDIIFKYSKDSNKLIEELMLLANKQVATYLKKQYLCVNRTHDEPEKEKLQQLKNFIKQFDYDIKINSAQEITVSLNKLLMDVQGKPEENLISNLVIKSMQKATYSTKNIGHYGLGFEDYCHFTSPIRRYPDVMVHRLLARVIENKPKPKLEKLESKCLYLSERERKAQKAERDSIKYMQTLYMAERVGMIYKGIITSVSEYGMFITIPENGCDCLVRHGDLRGDWKYDAENYCLKDIFTGQRFRLGDEIMIQITSVDVEKKNINATLVSK
jgi:ribonuclease R